MLWGDVAGELLAVCDGEIVVYGLGRGMHGDGLH